MNSNGVVFVRDVPCRVVESQIFRKICGFVGV